MRTLRFTNAILLLIVLSSITLALECPATVDLHHEDDTYDDEVILIDLL